LNKHLETFLKPENCLESVISILETTAEDGKRRVPKIIQDKLLESDFASRQKAFAALNNGGIIRSSSISSIVSKGWSF